MKVVVLASGEGSNFEALVRSAKDYAISSLISDKQNSGAISKAQNLGVRWRLLQNNLLTILREESPDLIALAGFIKILKPEIIDEFCCINIHPSLLPKHPGLNTHKKVLESGDLEHGCTVHLVDYGVDTGSKIAQAKLNVLMNETEESLKRRVKELEHKLFPWVLNNVAIGEIYFEKKISPIKVCYSPKLISEASFLGFIL